MRRRGLLRLAGLAAALPVPAWLKAQAAWPGHPVRVIVPFPAGQGTDVGTRYVVEQLTRSLGQQFWVDNKPGAGARVGLEMLARAAPDGYTLGIGTAGTHTINPNVYASLGYDAEADFAAISMTGELPLMIAAHPAFPAADIPALVAAARARPGTLNVALPALPQRIAFELLCQLAEAPLFGVPYRGTAVALPEVMGGQVPLILDSVTALKPHVDSGRLKALAVTSAHASPLMPGVKSVAEQGVAGYELTSWNALFAPAGTPAAIVERLSLEVRQLLQRPEARQRLMALGFEPVSSTPAELLRRIRVERKKWGRIVRDRNIKAE